MWRLGNFCSTKRSLATMLLEPQKALMEVQQLIDLSLFKNGQRSITFLSQTSCSRDATLCTLGKVLLQRDTLHRFPSSFLQFRPLLTEAQQTAKEAHRQKVYRNQSAQQGLYLIALVVGMVGLTYASVPLYRMFCQATGYGGTVQQGSTVEEKLKRRSDLIDETLEAAAAAREVTVSFNADVTDGMNWRFAPTQRSVRVHPGESTLAFYTAHNLSDKAITGVSTYNVSPQQAGVYFNKIQCFCFEEQKLRPGERIDMPVFFYIDPEFATDPRLEGINHLTLSYTFFKVDEEDYTKDNEPKQQSGSTLNSQTA